MVGVCGRLGGAVGWWRVTVLVLLLLVRVLGLVAGPACVARGGGALDGPEVSLDRGAGRHLHRPLVEGGVEALQNLGALSVVLQQSRHKCVQLGHLFDLGGGKGGTG